MTEHTAEFYFQLHKPQPPFTHVIQGLWSASVEPANVTGDAIYPAKCTAVKKWLYGDACSGVLFNMGDRIWLDDHAYGRGCIALPVSRQAHTMCLSTGAQLAGIRLQPGVRFPFVDANAAQAYCLDIGAAPNVWLADIYHSLLRVQSHQQRVDLLVSSLADIRQSLRLDPIVLRLLGQAQTVDKMQQVCETIPLSQRQLERKCQQALGMTIKKYQRVMRVRKIIDSIRCDPDQNLVDLALLVGCVDQSHMTRECKAIANITPKQLCGFYSVT